MTEAEAASSLGKVLVTAASVKGHEPALQLMRAAGCQLHLATAPVPFDEQWLCREAADAAALIVAMEPVSEAVLAAAPRLRIIARPGVGYDTVDLEAATRRGVAVTIAAGTNDQSVADFTFALLLAAARGLVPAVQSVAAHGWQRPVGTEVWGKTLAIVGFGRIGQAVARRALGFDMRVLAVVREPAAQQAHAGVRFVGFDEALESCDFLSLHLPLSPATHNLIDTAALARMKSGAFLINTSRGGLVDEEALAAAVRSGRLAGAAVDVLREQGAGSASALVGVPGILVTPHMASLAREAMARVAMAAAGAVVAGLRGERPETLVNPAAWRPGE